MRNFAPLVCFILIFLGSCAKDQNANVSFSDLIVSVGFRDANFTFTVDIQDGHQATECGIILSEQKSVKFLTKEDNNNGVSSDFIYRSSTETGGTHSVFFSDLLELKKYYYKPYCVVNGVIQYGAEDSIKTTAPPGVIIGPAGGYVIYDDGAGGGIEMALESVAIIDQSGYEEIAFTWGCEGTDVSGLISSVGSGENNSGLILQSCSETQTAASVCDSFVFNGFSDWYLPSRDELFLIRNNFAAFGYGQISFGEYWCSNQAGSNSADFIDMNSTGNSWYSISKNSKKRVRAVRSF